MEAKEPTQEQIKEFWEWCGVKPELNLGELMDSEVEVYQLPRIDLNNLFKYAVPQLITCDLYGNVPDMWKARVSLPPIPGKGIGKSVESDWYKDPALALFWAIWEVINGS